MTKAALKRRNARLIEKRDHMNELIEGNEQEIKELDSRESRELLEKFNIESEELAKLIYMRESANKEDAKPIKPAGRKARTPEVQTDSIPLEAPWDNEDDDEEAEQSDETGETAEEGSGYDPLNIRNAGKETEQ